MQNDNREPQAYIDDTGNIVIVGEDAWNRASFIDHKRAIPQSWIPLTKVIVDFTRLLSDLRSRLWARSENAYINMISVARKDESLGWEIKVQRGEFGRNELDSHTKMGELLGRHRALAEVCHDIDEVFKTNDMIHRPAEAGKEVRHD